MRLLKEIDLGLLFPVLGLLGISLSILFIIAPSLFTQQVIFILAGFILLIFFTAFDIRFWKKIVFIIYLILIILLILTFFGPEVRGSTRWIDFGFTRLQPSEIIKPFLIIVLARYFSEIKNNNFFAYLKSILLSTPIFLLIFKQPDLGNVLVLLFVLIALFIFRGASVRVLLIGSAVLFLVIPSLWLFLESYQKLRLISFVNPHGDPMGAGYNTIQSVITIGSGQFLGLGLGKGSQSSLNFLPEYHTDFIFAALTEQLGFLGAASVIIFYFIFLCRIIYIAKNCKDEFSRFVIVGIFSQIYIQTLINIGMNMGLLPITGITLPLISYGGSSIISTFISLGLMMAAERLQTPQYPIVIK